MSEQKMREALEFARVAIEPFDDEKPRCWKTDHERLRQAHSVVKAALSQPAAVVEIQEQVLTDDEIDSFFEDHGWCPDEMYYSVVRDIIAALEAKKNGGV